MDSIDRNRWISSPNGRKIYLRKLNLSPPTDIKHIFQENKGHNLQNKIYQHKIGLELVKITSKKDSKNEIVVCKEYWLELMLIIDI